MKRRIVAAAAVLLIMAGAVLPVNASPTRIELGVEVTAEAAYIVNDDTGRVVYQKNADRRMYPASTTKIMSAALAMTMCGDIENTMVTVPYDVWVEFDGIDISNAGIYGGEVMSMSDLVHCMLIQSANEAASSVAAYFGRDSFIEAMNRKAAELGCTGTHFVNPHGLFDENHYTTARDLYLITQWALTVPGFSEITSLSSYTLSETNVHSERDIYSTIMLQNSYSGYYTRYIKGIKTGTIDESGRCLVTRAESGGMSFTAVFLGCPFEVDTRFWDEGNSVFTNARLSFDWLFDNTAVSEVVKTGTPVSETALKYASEKDYLMLYAASPVSTIIQTGTGESPDITYETSVPEEIEAPVADGQVIGSARVYSDGVYVGDVDLIAMEDIKKSYFIYIMDRINRVLTSTPAIICYALLLVLAALYSYYMLVVVRRAESERNRGRRNR
ncbi:MAG: D-alanyl-D-alanine carboxypeptidase [Oscillospiraceae bacterium]|nr:D-alanyl-D-alanine carboxypeptidase [Oscillospiraceae bacterium]